MHSSSIRSPAPHLSANFAFAADLALLLGGRLKFEELLMGRLADAMGAIYLGYATLHHFSRHKHVAGLNALAESAMLQLEVEAQEALREASENFPKPLGAFGGWLMSLGIAPLGEFMRPYRPPQTTSPRRCPACSPRLRPSMPCSPRTCTFE